MLPIRLFIIQPFIVSGESMHPTFVDGDYLIVDQISYNWSEPRRGDVVVIKPPFDESRFFIKRIVGLPTETIKMHDGVVTIYNDTNLEGLTIDEPYAAAPISHDQTITLDQDEYFVMGDNRNASSDSRAWGPIESGNIVGRAFVRVLPPSEASVWPGSYRGTYETTTE